MKKRGKERMGEGEGLQGGREEEVDVQVGWLVEGGVVAP